MKKLPKNWVETTIEEATIILDNKRKPVSAKERSSRHGEVPYYGATGIAGWIDDYLFDEELVLLGEDGAPFFDKRKNVAYIVNGKSWVNNHAHVLKVKEGVSTNIFLLHYLNQFDYRDFVGGTTRLKLNQGNLKSIPFPLPPLPEQQRIVAKLDSLFASLDQVKARMEKIPELLKQFRQSVLTQAVTGKLTEEWREGKELEEWGVEILDNLCLSITDGDHQAPPKTDVGIHFFVISNVSRGFLDFASVSRFVPRDYFESLKKTRVPKKGDVLYTVTGSYGIPILVDSEVEFCFQRHIAILKPDNERLLSRYLFVCLNSSHLMIQAHEVATGTAQKTVPLRGIKKFSLNLPPLPEQTEIVHRVEALFSKADRIQEKYEALKAQIDTLPQALLAKAFKGELVEQLPTDGDARELLKEIAQLKQSTKKGKK